MSKKLLPLAVLALLASANAQAGLLVYTATLNGAAEAPPNVSPGLGSATVSYDDVAHTLRVEATFSGLSGNVTAAHIHCCTAAAGTGTVGVATVTPSFTGFPSGVTFGSYDHTFNLTVAGSFNASFVTANGSFAGAEAALAAGLLAGKSYFNIHSSAFPGGEIRGFLTAAAVPEPATWSLLGLGVLALRKRGLSKA